MTHSKKRETPHTHTRTLAQQHMDQFTPGRELKLHILDCHKAHWLVLVYQDLRSGPVACLHYGYEAVMIEWKSPMQAIEYVAKATGYEEQAIPGVTWPQITAFCREYQREYGQYSFTHVNCRRFVIRLVEFCGGSIDEMDGQVSCLVNTHYNVSLCCFRCLCSGTMVSGSGGSGGGGGSGVCWRWRPIPPISPPWPATTTTTTATTTIPATPTPEISRAQSVLAILHCARHQQGRGGGGARGSRRGRGGRGVESSHRHAHCTREAHTGYCAQRWAPGSQRWRGARECWGEVRDRAGGGVGGAHRGDHQGGHRGGGGFTFAGILWSVRSSPPGAKTQPKPYYPKMQLAGHW